MRTSTRDIWVVLLFRVELFTLSKGSGYANGQEGWRRETVFDQRNWEGSKWRRSIHLEQQRQAERSLPLFSLCLVVLRFIHALASLKFATRSSSFRHYKYFLGRPIKARYLLICYARYNKENTRRPVARTNEDKRVLLNLSFFFLLKLLEFVCYR